MSDVAIKIKKLKKQYRLGVIGGTTLNAELQSWWARKRGKEDPNVKLGEEYNGTNPSFWALNGIDLEVKKGEALGIIGSNGAGKSTLLKILSRVTAPTEGDIWINGRISSMLEVGTGFHGELTGRENIYMNGAILGMSKKEVDAKMEDIIEFSECRQFIDTPVKRYSSGMYVKLAFAVAANLDSEILVMDEVLAVGDMKFQKKCLGKMGDVAENEGKTVLYVSHNMATIRNLCTRCIVLNKGRMIFDGDVESAINIYMNESKQELATTYDFAMFRRGNFDLGKKIFVQKMSFPGKDRAVFKNTEKIKAIVTWKAIETVEQLRFGLSVKCHDGSAAGLAEMSGFVRAEANHVYESCLEIDLINLIPGMYYLYLQPYFLSDINSSKDLDETARIAIEIEEGQKDHRIWYRQYWGNTRLRDIRMIDTHYV